MEDKNRQIIRTLTEQANEIVAGSYINADKLFRLTDKNNSSGELAELAEAFGMMTVKIEARELALEQTIEELKKKNARIESLNSIRSQLSSIFVNVVLLVTSYIFILGLIKDEFLLADTVIIFLKKYPVIEIPALFIVLRIIRSSNLKIKDFGLTFSGWKRSVSISLAVSFLVIAVLAGIKYYVNKHTPGIFRENSIFDVSYFGVSYITYLITAPLQEFVTRGTVQGSLERLLEVRHKGFISILVTTFLFGALHMFHSFSLAIASFITGWILGYMYLRQRNLVGVSLAHFLIGNAAGLMGYWNFF